MSRTLPCVYCGHQVAPNAPTCPSCGGQSPCFGLPQDKLSPEMTRYQAMTPEQRKKHDRDAERAALIATVMDALNVVGVIVLIVALCGGGCMWFLSLA